MDTLSSIFSVEAARKSPSVVTIAALATALLVAHRAWHTRRRRTRTLPPNEERVLVLGASSGIGQAIAHEYAARGARVCVVGRRERELDAVADECRALCPNATGGPQLTDDIFAFRGDFTRAEDMVALREDLQKRESPASNIPQLPQCFDRNG